MKPDLHSPPSGPANPDNSASWRRSVWLRLGRVSNLPTVWTNVGAAGWIAAGSDPTPGLLLRWMLALSLFYVGGMYLNDAFDRKIDARERPERPIPSGEVTAATVFVLGFAMLALGWAAIAWGGGQASMAAGAGLAAMIVLYNLWHKGNPIGPVLMGACRTLVYATVGWAAAVTPASGLWLAALALWLHIIGLSYVAKQENRLRFIRHWPLAVLAAPPLSLIALRFGSAPPEPLVILPFVLLLCGLSVALLRALRLLRQPGMIGRAVAQLIAATCLLDGLAVTAAVPLSLAAATIVALIAFAAWGGTLLFQTWISGT